MADDSGWEAPGPGVWVHDGSHSDRPATGFVRSIGNAQVRDGLIAGFARTGIALGAGRGAEVNGWPYVQPGFPDATTFDALEAAARDFVTSRRWVERLADWEERRRPDRLAVARAHEGVDVGSLDDAALLDHLDDLIAARRVASWTHFEQHSLCVLIGDLVLATRSWGIADTDVLPLLEGHSPASARTRHHLDRICEALREAGVVPRTLDEIRAASAAAAAALDEYLQTFGSQVVGGFDLDRRTLRELPKVVLASIVAALHAPEARPAGDVRDDVRARIPVAERARFDELLDAARSVYGLRDDDVFFTVWESGLVRRVLLEVAERLDRRGRLHDRNDVFEVAHDELRAMLVDDAGPSADDLAARARRRAEQAALVPPPVLGEGAPAAPPLDALGPTSRRLTEAMLAYTQLRRLRPTAEPLTGIGVGGAVYRGRAVVARDADQAFDRLEPGDVLVTPLTTPAFNGVLPLCGAIVVEDAGLLSHAAVMSRELGIAALLGVHGATRAIPDGSEVEVDPVGGRVTILANAPS